MISEYTTILSELGVILFHGIRPLDSESDGIGAKMEDILSREQTYDFLVCSTIGYDDLRESNGPRKNYWSALGYIVNPFEILFADSDDAGSSKPQFNPSQIEHYKITHRDSGNLRNSVLDRDDEGHNEIGVSKYLVCGWLIDLNRNSSTLAGEFGLGPLYESMIAEALSVRDWPIFSWDENKLRLLTSVSPIEYGEEINLKDFYNLYPGKEAIEV